MRRKRMTSVGVIWIGLALIGVPAFANGLAASFGNNKYDDANDLHIVLKGGGVCNGVVFTPSNDPGGSPVSVPITTTGTGTATIHLSGFTVGNPGQIIATFTPGPGGGTPPSSEIEIDSATWTRTGSTGGPVNLGAAMVHIK